MFRRDTECYHNTLGWPLGRNVHVSLVEGGPSHAVVGAGACYIPTSEYETSADKAPLSPTEELSPRCGRPT